MKPLEFHSVTVRALARRRISDADLARILDCTEPHASDLIAGVVVPNARERAILRLCANASIRTLRLILGDMSRDYEWRRIPGFERYEASELGQVRRVAGGHGSMPGVVLKPRWSAGYLWVNIARDGHPVAKVAIHRAVCLAFHGRAPSPAHMVCHKNDDTSNNQKDNLYWGTGADNARDRIRNSTAISIGTKLTREAAIEGGMAIRTVQKYVKKAMAYRLTRRASREKVL